MPHFLDVGFHWGDLTASGNPPTSPADACTLSYAFQRSNGEPEGQKDFHAAVNDEMEVRVFELNRVPGVHLQHIDFDFENVGTTSHPIPSPMIEDFVHGHGSGGPAPGPHGHGHIDPHGVPNQPSMGLNSLGTKWEPTGVFRLKHQGTFLVTVRIRAAIHQDVRHWIVDPKIIVGMG